MEKEQKFALKFIIQNRGLTHVSPPDCDKTVGVKANIILHFLSSGVLIYQ
uniref:Uncharacterized protein n=1 Tax=Anguilla anguilla TaxID=7936 RepID=A0A0E9WEK2_ANGAN